MLVLVFRLFKQARFAAAALILVHVAGCEKHVDEQLCDGSADVRLTFRVRSVFGAPGNGFVEAYGARFLAIDGTCRYWAGFDDAGEIRTGSLTREQAARITRDTRYDPAEADKHAWKDNTNDGSSYHLRVGRNQVDCFNCLHDEQASHLGRVMTSAATLQRELVSSGTPLNGPIRVLAQRLAEEEKREAEQDQDALRSAKEWTLGWSPDEARPRRDSEGADDGKLVTAPEDVAKLRALRGRESPVLVRDSSQQLFWLYVRPELPAAVLLGWSPQEDETFADRFAPALQWAGRLGILVLVSVVMLVVRRRALSHKGS